MVRSTRDERGRLFIYLWKRLLPELQGITDTQCGFKAFEAGHLRGWITETRDSSFSFDVEALLHVRRSAGRIVKVPIAWIDSGAASTTAELSPYLPMLKTIANLRSPGSDRAARFASLIGRLDEACFSRLVDNVLPSILGREPTEYDRFGEVSPESLAELAGVSLEG